MTINIALENNNSEIHFSAYINQKVSNSLLVQVVVSNKKNLI